jgi:hypothetical protein
MKNLDVEFIAKVCHQVNKAYCKALGDISQPDWDDAPDWQKESAINGVQYRLANPDATSETQHIQWMKVKSADGWQYGPVKDPAKKEHPCMVPYDELPVEQRAKDPIFAAICNELR